MKLLNVLFKCLYTFFLSLLLLINSGVKGQKEPELPPYYVVNLSVAGGLTSPAGSFSKSSGKSNLLGKSNLGWGLSGKADLFIRQFGIGLAFNYTNFMMENPGLSARINEHFDQYKLKKYQVTSDDKSFECSTARLAAALSYLQVFPEFIIQARLETGIGVMNYGWEENIYTRDSTFSSYFFSKGTKYHYYSSSGLLFSIQPEIDLKYVLLSFYHCDVAVTASAGYFLSGTTLRIYEDRDSSTFGTLDPETTELFKISDRVSFINCNAGFNIIFKLN